VAFPGLRAAKNRSVRAAMAAGAAPRARQADVWAAVAAKAERHGATSDTDALRDVFDARADALGPLEDAFSRRDGQLGAVVAIGGEPVLLDFVSRPEVFAALWPRLLRGYCLDALEHDAVGAAPDVAGFLQATLAAHGRPSRAVGLGTTQAFSTPAVGGTGLAFDGELVQLGAFAEHPEPARPGAILRPSRRRP
jgi:hypothetical protein